MPEEAKRPIPMFVWQALLGFAVLLGWQELVNTGKLDKFFFSRPTDIAGRIATWVTTGSIFLICWSPWKRLRSRLSWVGRRACCSASD